MEDYTKREIREITKGKVQKNKKWKPGYIYVINYGNDETFKVGFTRGDPIERFDKISRSEVLMPYKMSLVMSVFTETNCHYIENTIHMLYDRCHVNGEWYSLDKSQLINLYKLLSILGIYVDLYDGWWNIFENDNTPKHIMKYLEENRILPPFWREDYKLQPKAKQDMNNNIPEQWWRSMIYKKDVLSDDILESIASWVL